MSRQRNKALGTYALSFFLCINSIWVSFYPTLVNASTYEIVDGKLVLPDNKTSVDAKLNEGNWDGALLIKQFQLPELKEDDAPPGLDSTTGNYSSDSSNFTDATQKHLKNEVYLQQLFPGYSSDALNTYLSDIGVYQTDPNLIQDDLVTLQDLVTKYSGVDCSTVSQEEQDDCKKSQVVSALDEMKNNAGKTMFAGANDTIIQSTADFIDGNHPYFDELYNEECKEVTTDSGDGDAIGLTETRVCTSTEAQLATCKVERYMETEFVDTKVILEYTPKGKYEILRNSYAPDNFDIQPCEGAEDTCLEITTLETSYFYQTKFFDTQKFRADGFEIKFEEGIKVTGGEVVAARGYIRVQDKTVNLTTYPDLTENIVGLVGQKIHTLGGKFFDSDPSCDFYPSFMENIEGSLFGIYPDYSQDCSNPYVNGLPPYVSEPSNVQTNDENVLLLVKKTIFEFTEPNAVPFDEIYPFAYVDNMTRYRIYFEVPPLNEGVNESYVSAAIVDDISNYPQGSNINIAGVQIPITIDVFDIDLYPANQFIPTNIQVVGDTVNSFTVSSIGRPTNQWRYQVDIEFSAPGPFNITADMHRIVDQGFRPMEGEGYCQIVIDAFLENTFPATATCDYELGQRTNPTGVVFDEPHRGYLKVMPSWGENGNPPLDEMCWEATITVDPTSGVGLSEDDKTLSCAGLEDRAYDDCMKGQWCTYDDINGEYVCTDTSNGLKKGFSEACSSYLNNPKCTYKSDKTRCEEWHEDENGNPTCLYESHFFECDVETNGYGIPDYADEVETVCGGPVNCMNGECSNIKKESNQAFAEAAVFSQLADQMRKAKNCATESDPQSCQLFSGEIAKCNQPLMWGASDCCDPDAMGMGGMDVFAVLKALEYMELATENEAFVGWMSETWTGIQGYVQNTELGQWAGNATKSVVDPITSAADSLSNQITSGFESFMETLGFDPVSAGEATAAAAQSAGSANAAAATTAAATQEAATSLFGDGLMQFIAQGVYDFISSFAPELASEIFATTAAAEGTGQVVTGFANESVNETVAFVAEWLSTIMLYYTIYKLIVGFVYGCKERDYATAQKIKLLSNHYVGTYCAEKLAFGACVRKVQTHCVYGSPFARIMAEQIKLQLAEADGIPIEEYWIDPAQAKKKLPNCSGFTLAELENVNWDRVDLTEFLQITMGMMKYDPNNIPSDFVASEREAGGRSGPSAGVTNIESNIAAVTVAAKTADFNRNTMTSHNMQLVDPDFMPWYQGTNGTGTGCTFTCDQHFVYNSASGICEKVERLEVPGNKTCNASDGYVYDLGVDRCVKTETQAIKSGCPSTYVLNETTGKCEAINYKNVPADITCPIGTTWSSAAGRCQEVDTVSTTNDCSAHGVGYVYQDGLCILESISDIDPSKTCPSQNYTLVGDTCSYSSVQPYQVTCPAGEVYDPQNNTCVLVSSNSVPAIVSCPDGLTLEGDICIVRETEVAVLLCDTADGWTLNGNQCEKSQTVAVEPNQACPQGYFPTSDGTQCRRYVLAESDPPQCPPDWALVSGGYCVKDVVETKSAGYGCQLGFTFDGTACSRELRYPAAVACDIAAGYIYNGFDSCVKTDVETISAVKVCNEGTLVGDVCHIPTQNSPRLGCPSGYTLTTDKTACEKRELQITQPIVTCPEGFVPSGIHCLRTTTVPADKECPVNATYSEERDACYELIEIIKEPEAVCPEGYALVGSECVTREVVEATAICDDPEATYDPHSKKCYKDVSQYTQADELCAEGSPEFIAGTCSTAVEKPPVYECPLGYFYSYEQSICVSEVAESVDPIIVCETDWSYDATLKVCVKTDTYSGITCEEGFTFNVALGQCEKAIEIPATPFCSDGYAFDGASCVRVIHASYECPADYQYSSLTKACEKLETDSGQLVCDLGFTLVNGSCINDALMPPSCQDGYVYDPDSDQCKIVSPVAVQHSCAAPYYDDGNGCAKLNTSVTTCPDGMVFDANLGRCGGAQPPVENYCPVGVDSGSDCRVKEQNVPLCDSPEYHYDVTLQKCIKEDSVRGTPYCPFSEEYQVVMQNERCAYYSVTAPLPNGDCQSTYSLNENGYCVKYELFERPYYSCPVDYFNAPDSNGDPSITSPFCLKSELREPVCDIANGYVFADGFCEKYHSKPYSQRCFIDGEYREGQACISVDVSSIECPSGYGFSSANGRCEFIELIAYTKVCPATHTLQNDQCVSANTAPAICPDNHTFNPSTDLCEPIELAPICPNAYVYNSTLDKCELREEIPADGSCPSGTFDTGSGCRAFHDARCNDAYVLDTVLDKCVKDELILATPICPDGQYWDNGSGCVPYEAVVCSDGYTLNPVTDMCERADVIQASTVCPSGTMWTVQGCIRYSAPNCPPLYDYDPDRKICAWEQVSAPGETCPDGYEDTGSGCQKFVDASCTDGYTLNPSTDLCEKLDQIPADPSCPNGSRDTGSGCVNQQQPTCNTPGYTFVPENDRCEKYETKPANAVCNAGDVDTGSGCQSRSIPTCSTGYTFVASRDRCEKYESIPASGTCTEGNDTGDGCSVLQTTNASCPAGYTPNGLANCQRTLLQNPTCSAGYTYSIPNNRCEKLEQTQPTCANGYNWDLSLKMCIKLSDKAESCPIIDGHSGTYTLGSCSYSFTITTSCPAGWTTGAATQGGTTCTFTQPANKACPTGFSPYASDPTKCYRTEALSCDAGYTYSSTNKQCEKNDALTPTCPSGFNYDSASNNCKKVTSATPSCPKQSGKTGFLRDSQCEYVGIFYGNSCPLGWTLDSVEDDMKICSATFPPEYQCSVGVLSGQNCIQTASYSCPNGYSWSNDKCRAVLTDVPNCSSGYSYQASTNSCIKLVNYNYSCPLKDGTSGSLSGSTCNYSRIVSASSCPVGWSSTNISGGKLCQRTASSVQDPCPAGTVEYPSNTSKCYKQGVISCSVGSYNSATAKCERTLTATPTCQTGYNYISSLDKCSKIETASYQCPATYGYNSSNGLCERVTNQEYDGYVCPNATPAYVLNGSSCERTVTSTPDCPQGQTYDSASNECRSATKPYSYTCDLVFPPWSLAGQECSRLLTELPKCAAGYTYNSTQNKCESNTIQNYLFTCPDATPPYSKMVDSCSRILTELPICPNGYSFNDTQDMCQKNVLDPYEIFCSPDFDYDPVSKMCLKEVTTPPTCESGWTFVSERNRCEKDVPDPYGYECPNATPAYTLVGQNCERTLQSAPQCIAPYSYNTQRDRCEAPQLDYGFKCPATWTLVGERCERQLQHDPICDIGFTYNTVSDRCESNAQSDYIYDCPDGWVVQGSICYRYVYDDPSCTAEYIFENDVCRPFEQRTPTFVCMDGWVDIGGSCERTVRQPVNCPEGYLYSPQADQCSKYETAVVGFQCPDAYTLSGSVCRFKSTSGQTLTCDVGYTFDTELQQCSRTEYAYPVYICPVGYDLMEDERYCIKVIPSTTEPVGITCPYTGFELVDDVCILVFNNDMSHYCSDSSYQLIANPGNLQPKIDGPFVCHRVVREFSEPSRSCPLDYEVYATDYCTQYQAVPMIYACAPDFSPSSDGTQCIGQAWVQVPPIYSCPSSYEKNGSTCINNEIAIADLACSSSNATIVDGTCRASVLIDSTSPILQCDNGDDATDGTCDAFVVTLPEYSCPNASWTLVKQLGLCQRSTTDSQEPDYTCPSDMTLDGKECVKEQSHGATLSCPTSAWVLDGLQCKREYTQTKPADICKDGDVFRFNACFTPEYHPFVEGCSSGQTFNSTLNLCEYTGTVYESPIAVCNSAGFVPVGLTCIKQNSSNVIYSCSDASRTLVGSQCYEETISGGNPQFGCPYSFTDTGTDCSYSNSVPADITCPQRFYYNPSTNTCQTDEVSKKPATFICPADYQKVDEFTCRKVVASLPPIYSCESPARLYGTECRIRTEIEIEPGYCEPPYEMAGTSCQRTLTQYWDLTCPTGTEKYNNLCYQKTVTSAVPMQVCN